MNMNRIRADYSYSRLKQRLLTSKDRNLNRGCGDLDAEFLLFFFLLILKVIYELIESLPYDLP